MRFAILVVLHAVLAAGEAHWQPVGWGGGGYYWSCAFHPTAAGVIYLGGDVNGVYRSDDHGRTWRMRNAGLSSYAIYGLAVDPAHPDVVYAATPDGTCVSEDRGEHWTFLAASAKEREAIIATRGGSVRALAVADDGALYAATPGGHVARSDDRGATWTRLREIEKGSCSAIALGQEGALILVASSAGLLRSIDRGRTWTTLTPPQPRSAAIAPSDARVLYAACGERGLFVSGDGGDSWTRCALPADAHPVEASVDPRDPSAVVVIAAKGWGGTVYRSADRGATWTTIGAMRADGAGDPTLPEEGASAGFSSLTSIARSPAAPDELYIAANWRCAWSGDGGATWEERERGADITCVTDIRFLGRTAYVTAMDEGLFASDDAGKAWRQLAPRRYTAGVSGHHWRVHAWRDGATTRVVSTCSPWDKPLDLVLVGEDGGAFAPVSAGLPPQRPKRDTMWGEGHPRALAADPRDANDLWLGIDGEPDERAPDGGGVFRSRDGGRTWKQLAHQPGSRRIFNGLAVDPREPKRLWWGCCGDKGGVWKSEDEGESWTRTSLPETWVFNVAVASDGAVYAGAGELWRSDDLGATWRKLTSGGGGTVVGIEIRSDDEKTVWCSRATWGDGTQGGGVFRTRDGGTTWQEITGDLPHRTIQVLRYDPATERLWAGNVGLYAIEQP